MGANDAASSKDADRHRPRYDWALLFCTMSTVKQAVNDLEALSIGRITARTNRAPTSGARSAAVAALGAVLLTAAVACALYHCALEVKKQLVPVDAPHRAMFATLEIHDDDGYNEATRPAFGHIDATKENTK